MEISLFIAGDVVPKGITAETFVNCGRQIFKDVKPHIIGADYSIVNFEAPVINSKATPIKKSGPCLGVAPSTVDVLKDAGFSIFTLANNHFFDQGQYGVENTLNKCSQSEILTVGGGKNIADARKPLLLEKENVRIAIINACEHEFSIADNEHGGSNPLDLINMQEDIAKVRKDVDYIILILHGGVEEYHYPTPRMKRWYRHFVDLGADAVINHHQHCINGYEVYKGKPIIYGIGNFYFPWGDQERQNSWYYGYAVKLIIDNTISFELIPYCFSKDLIALRDKNEFEREIELFNLPIKDEYLLQQKFNEYAIDREYVLKSQLIPSTIKNKCVSLMARRGWLGKLYKTNDLLLIKNKLCCESHIELFQRLFTILTK